VSERSYIVAGLATAIAGVAVASPVLAQSQIHLPTVAGNVELASEVSSVAQHAVSTGAVEVSQISDAVRHVVASAPHGAATAATDLAGGPLVEKAAVTAVARAVTAVVAASRNSSVGGVGVHRDSASSPAVAAAAPNLQGILGIPLLALDIPLDVAQSAFQALTDASAGLSQALFGLGTGDSAIAQFGLGEIASSIPDAVMQVVDLTAVDVKAIASALGFNVDAADRNALAGIAKVADAKNQAAVKKSLEQAKPDTAPKRDISNGAGATKDGATKDGATKPESTKDGAAAKPEATKSSSHSSTAAHHTGAATVKDAGDKGATGATKAGGSAHHGHPPGAASHPGGSGAKHSDGAGAKKGPANSSK
jgi:hypothetical protein